MKAIHLKTNLGPGQTIESSIQSLRAELQCSRAEEKRYILELNSLHSIRAKISASLEDLAANYKKELKSLQHKVKKLQNQNKQLKNQNALYQMEIQNFQKRLVEKDTIISSILAKDFYIPARVSIPQKEYFTTLESQIKQSHLQSNSQISQQKIQSPQHIQEQIQINDSRSRYKLFIQDPKTKQKGDQNRQESITQMQQTKEHRHNTNIQIELEIESEKQNITQHVITPTQANIYTLETQINNLTQTTSNQKNIQNSELTPAETPVSAQLNQPSSIQPSQMSESLQPQVIVKKILPPPKRGPVPVPTGSKLVKKPLKTKIVPKYKQSNAYFETPIEQQTHTQQQRRNDAPQINKNYQQQNNFLGGFELRTNYHQIPTENHDIIANQEHQVAKNLDNSPVQFEETPKFISNQREECEERQNVSHASIPRSKKAKRPKPRPIEQEPMNFEDDIIPVTQMEPSTSIDFFTSLATQKVYQTAKDENLTKFEPQAHQDDHQMHGLVDESSIEQIDDISMMSNPIFPEDHEMIGLRVQSREGKKRKGSTDDQERQMVQEGMGKGLASKKMSKKKAKRETVEVMDPSSFL